MHNLELRFLDDGTVITNENIAEESLEIYERICSEDRLVYGSCEATSVKMRIRSNDAFKLRSFELRFDGTLLGTFRVESDKATADRCYKDIVAYDALYRILNSVCTAWYNRLEFPMTLRQFRDAFFEHYGIEQQDVNLINDSMMVEKTVEAETINASTVLKAICELNACFGHINAAGLFQYLTLYAPGMTPAMPAEPVAPITAEYADFTTGMVEKVIIRKEEGDAGATAGSGSNAYIIEDNFLCYGKSAEQLQTIAQRIFEKIRMVTYTPVTINTPHAESLRPGTYIGFMANGHGFTSYVLERTITGIQSQMDEIVAQGMKTYKVTTSGYGEQIILLKNRTNMLLRNVDETRSTITDLEEGLTTDIKQNAGAINAEVIRAQDAEQQLRAAIQISENAIRAEVTERTSLYNEEVNSIKGGTDGNIDLSFFPNAETEFTVSTIQGKQCIVAKQVETEALELYQDASLPAGTFKLSYEWLRQAALFRDESVVLYSYTPTATKLYEKDLGTAWIDDNVWFQEEFEFTLQEPARVRFILRYSQDYMAPERTMDIAITNIRLMGRSQSVADALGEMKAEILIQSEEIAAKVSKGEVVAAINLTPETTTIQAAKIDLKGLVQAEELQAAFIKATDLEATNGRIARIESSYITADTVAANYATVTALASTNAEISNIKTNYITAATVAANYATVTALASTNAEISNIKTNYITAATVKANYMEVANWVSAGKIRADRIDVNSIKANIMTVENISAACADPSQGKITIGTIRAQTFQYYNGSGYLTLYPRAVKGTDGKTYYALAYS